VWRSGLIIARGPLHALELPDGFSLKHLLHVGLPNHGRGDASIEAVQLPGVFQIVLQGLAAFRVSHPDPGKELWGVADAPGIEEVLASARLAGYGPVAYSSVARDALRDVSYHDLGRFVGYLRVYYLLAFRFQRLLVEDLLTLLPLIGYDFGDHGWLHAASPVRYGRVGRRHIQR